MSPEPRLFRRPIGPAARAARWVLLVLVVVSIQASTRPAEARRSSKPKVDTSPATTEAWIASLRQAELREGEEWSVYVRDLKTGDTILSYDPSQRLIPASNRKLIVFALAIEKLGADFKFRTEFGISRYIEKRGSTLTGSVVLRSDGDPTLRDKFIGDKNPATLIREWIALLAARGIRRIQGDFIIDASAFGTEQDVHPDAWGGDHVNYSYAPYPSALALNENLLRVRASPSKSGQKGSIRLYPSMEGITVSNETKTIRGSRRGLDAKFAADGSLAVTGQIGASVREHEITIPMARPLEIVRGIVVDELRLRGIEVAGKIRVLRDPAEGRRYPISALLASHESPPLSSLLHTMLRESDNFIAEQVWRATSFRATGAGDPVSARRMEAQWLASNRIGWVEPGYDGSGLSRRDHYSAQDLVALLDVMYRSAAIRPHLLASMPCSGQNGTLAGRCMGGDPGRVIAKTGTLLGAQSLSGFIRDARGGERWVFAMVGNAPSSTKGRLKLRQDQIIKILFGLLDYGRQVAAAEPPPLRAEPRIAAEATPARAHTPPATRKGRPVTRPRTAAPRTKTAPARSKTAPARAVKKERQATPAATVRKGRQTTTATTVKKERPAPRTGKTGVGTQKTRVRREGAS